MKHSNNSSSVFAVSSSNPLTKNFLELYDDDPLQALSEDAKFLSVSSSENKQGELIPTGVPNGWRVDMDYMKMKVVTRYDHFPPFTDKVFDFT